MYENFMSDLIPAIMFILVMGMFFGYLTVRLVIKSRMASKEKAKSAKGGKQEPFQSLDVENLLARCETLSHRVMVLEEILAAEKAREKN